MFPKEEDRAKRQNNTVRQISNKYDYKMTWLVSQDRFLQERFKDRLGEHLIEKHKVK